MICSKCGANNIEGSSFCIKCGTNLKEIQQSQSFNREPIQSQQQVSVQQENQMYSQQQVNTQQNIQKTKEGSLNYFSYIIAVLLKPFKSFNEEEVKLSNAKNSLILTLIITIAMTLVNLVTTIFTTVRVSDFDWSAGYTYSWQWDNLKYINWGSVIGKNFFMYLCAIFTVAAIFYIGSLIVKRELNFIKSLSITTTSILPAIMCSMIISPLIGKIWSPLSIVFTSVGIIYSLIILYELMNTELKLDKDKKIYFNLVCFGILTIAGYYAFIKLFASSTGLDGLLNLFQ